MERVHGSEVLVRYCDGELDGAEAAEVEQHLRDCAECREFVGFSRAFKDKLRAYLSVVRVNPGPCPDTLELAELAGGMLEGEVAERVTAHLIRCVPCMRAYLQLLHLAELGDPPSMSDELIRGEGSPEPPSAETYYVAGAVVGLDEETGLMQEDFFDADVTVEHTWEEGTLQRIETRVIRVGNSTYQVRYQTLPIGRVICQVTRVSGEADHTTELIVQTSNGAVIHQTTTDLAGNGEFGFAVVYPEEPYVLSIGDGPAHASLVLAPSN